MSNKNNKAMTQQQIKIEGVMYTLMVNSSISLLSALKDKRFSFYVDVNDRHYAYDKQLKVAYKCF